MIDIENLLSSISDEDMAKIKSIAESLTEKGESQQTQEPKNTESTPNLPIDMSMMQKIMGLMQKPVVQKKRLQPTEL